MSFSDLCIKIRTKKQEQKRKTETEEEKNKKTRKQSNINLMSTYSFVSCFFLSINQCSKVIF